VLGHGSGSFGHWEASQYGTREGVASPEGWVGFSRVSAAALQLNRIVTQALVSASVPALSLQPCASALADDGSIIRLEADPIHRALRSGLVPLIFGDVAFDAALGGTILSTEDLFVHLAPLLRPSWIVLAGNAPGVLNSRGDVIPEITPETLAQFEDYVRGSSYTDVTGGMADKVGRMLELVTQLPGTRVRILSGAGPGVLRAALDDPVNCPYGTLVHAADARDTLPQTRQT
jgi:isopentenyl phosphate kinase